jgi:hypothetical protein
MATKRLDSKSARVRELLAQGVGAADIARQVGCTVSLVYDVKSRMGGAALRRPAHAPQLRSNGSCSLDDFIETVRRSERERQRLRATLQAVARVIAEVL